MATFATLLIIAGFFAGCIYAPRMTNTRAMVWVRAYVAPYWLFWIIGVSLVIWLGTDLIRYHPEWLAVLAARPRLRIRVPARKTP